MALRPLGIKKDDKSQNRLLGDNFRSIENNFRTNVVRQANGNAIVTGRLPGDNGYGQILYKEDGSVAIVRSNTDWDGETANIVKEGKLPYSGGYGSLHYDATDARILIGIDPDGSMNIHISKPGEDVVTDVFS